jgi:hypothetical protein
MADNPGSTGSSTDIVKADLTPAEDESDGDDQAWQRTKAAWIEATPEKVGSPGTLWG